MQSDWLLLGPLDWMRYVNKQVRVKTGKDEEQRGWMLTVDPVSASVVLVNFSEVGGASVQVVMGHAVVEVQVLQEADRKTTEQLAAMFRPQPARSFSPDELRRRKESVRRWLEKNRLPVEEEDDDGEVLKVAAVLTIRAPYGGEDCRSSNEIILDRIQKLLETNPENLDQPGHT
ncbi:gem-associated protein 6 [Genypterus blacodes]|uniref:gem-associated protein 6 n=1 Tax=Genypterus blacodes TaxID=154954 RepID=UPI003F7627E9